MPESTFVSVVFPAPLRPTSPTRSPAVIWKETIAHEQPGADSDGEVVHGDHGLTPWWGETGACGTVRTSSG